MKKTDALANIFSFAGVLFFAAAWWLADIYVATAVLMAVMTANVVIIKLMRRPLEKITLAVWLLVLVMGTLTLLLRDKAFIQLKTTIVYAVFAVALLASEYIWKKNLLRMALQGFFDAPPAVWRRAVAALAVFFVTLSVCNFFVARHLSEAAWVGIKTFGFPAATLVFMLCLLAFMFRYAKPLENE